MEPNVQKSIDELPPREWPGYDYELYFDEAVTALQSYRPEVRESVLAAESVNLLNELRDRSAADAAEIAFRFEGVTIEVEGTSYTLGSLCGAGEDGMYFHASTSNNSGVLKVSWPFNPSRESASDLDRLRLESSLMERQAMLEIAYGPDVIPFEGAYVLPRLYADGFIVAETDGERFCSSTLFMEHMEGEDFLSFMNDIEQSNSLVEFVEVSVGALNAQFYLAELGDPDEPQRGVFRMDNGVHNLLVQRNERGCVPVCLDYGSVLIPAFTGEGGNPSLSLEENQQLQLNFAVEQLRRALADSLRNSTLSHDKKQDVINLLDRSGSTNPSELLDGLKELHRSLLTDGSALNPLADTENIKLPSLTNVETKRMTGKAKVA